MLAADGTEVVRARALQVALADASRCRRRAVPPPPGPEDGRDNDFDPPHRPDVRARRDRDPVRRRRFGGGPSTAWFRLRAPIVAGEEPTPLQRLAAAGDFGNGISTMLPWGEYLFINPDLTLYIERRAGR